LRGVTTDDVVVGGVEEDERSISTGEVFAGYEIE
jgi:hypothetical protein